MNSKVLKFRPAIDATALDRADEAYADHDEHLRRVHAVRKKIKTRTRWAKDFQRRLLSQLDRVGRANGFTPPSSPVTAAIPMRRARS